MNFYLMPTIEMGPKVVIRILRFIPADRLDYTVEQDRFTPREVAAHLADWEPIMRERIRTAAERPGATLEVYDEAAMAVDHRYDTSDPAEQCALFARERALTAAYIRSLTSEQWTRAANHPERGGQTAEDLANLLLGHDLYHIEQLTAHLI